MRRRLAAALWAFHNSDRLTMLRHEMAQDAKGRNSRGGITLAAARATFYLRYLLDLPIR